MRTEHALAIVRGQLRRSPTDALEAAVVLEASAGITSERALGLGRAAVKASRVSARERGRLPAVVYRLVDSPDTATARLVALLAFIALLAALGASTVSAWRAAMVVGFALQGLLFRRYLTGEVRLGIIRRYPVGLVACVVAAAGFATILSRGHTMAAALLAIWIGGIVIAERGWTPVYVSVAAIIVLARIFTAFNHPEVITITVCATVCAVAALTIVAVATTAPSNLRPCSWSRAMFSIVAAAGFGLMIWLLPPNWAFNTVRFAPRERYALYYAAIPLLMALIGSTWAASHLNELWKFAPRVFSQTALDDNAADTARGIAHDVFGGAAVRLAFAWVVALIVILSLSVSKGFRPELKNALELVMLLFAITTLAVEVALLDSFQYPTAALTAVVVAVGTTLALNPIWSRAVAIALGSIVGIVLASLLLARQVRRSPLIFVTHLG